MKPVVLVVDDEPLQRGILQTILNGEGYETLIAASGSEALAAIRKVPPDVVVSDLKMAGMDGIELLNALPKAPTPPPMIIVTAHGTIDSAVEAVKLGAFDYLTKPLDKQKILMAVRKACERSDILKENARLKKELFERFRMEGIIARSPRMRGPSKSSSGSPIPQPRSWSSAKAAPARNWWRGRSTTTAAAHQAVHRDQLRGHPGDPLRERAVRP